MKWTLVHPDSLFGERAAQRKFNYLLRVAGWGRLVVMWETRQRAVRAERKDL